MFDEGTADTKQEAEVNHILFSIKASFIKH